LHRFSCGKANDEKWTLPVLGKAGRPALPGVAASLPPRPQPKSRRISAGMRLSPRRPRARPHRGGPPARRTCAAARQPTRRSRSPSLWCPLALTLGVPRKESNLDTGKTRGPLLSGSSGSMLQAASVSFDLESQGPSPSSPPEPSGPTLPYAPRVSRLSLRTQVWATWHSLCSPVSLLFL
jgi:hypothetical protein